MRGLRGGADDYVTKWFTVEVLEARVQALLRQVSREQPAGPVGWPRQGWTMDAS